MMPRRVSSFAIPLAILLALPALATAHGVEKEPYIKEEAFLKEVSFDQKLGAEVPLNLTFRDETGRAVTLGSYFGTRPVIMLLTYYNCTMLCPVLMDGLVRALRPLSFDMGKQYTVLTVSINPRETPSMGAARKDVYIQRYDRKGASDGWHFLTGKEEAIRQLTQAVGFRYVYDAKKDEYAHAAGIMILTPHGKVSRYYYGVEFVPRDLRLALVEAAANSIGTPVDQLLLYCYHYDPLTGKYGLIIMNVLRLAGTATVFALGGFVLVMLRRDHRADLRPREAR
jgi:protein SCO1/2